MHRQEERAMNNADLEKRLTEHVTEQLALGNREAVAHWIPDSYEKSKLQLYNTLSTSFQVLQLANANAERVCRYLLAVMRGFLQSPLERTYLKPLGAREEPSAVEFPTYTLDETTRCVMWLVDQRAASYERIFAELVQTHLNQEQYATMWSVAEINPIYLEGPTVRTCDFAYALPRVWGASPARPQAFEDRDLLQAQGRRASVSLNIHLARGQFHVNRERGQAFTEVTQDLSQRLAVIRSQLQQVATPDAMQAELAQARDNFDAAPDRVAMATSAYSKCYHWCNQLAKLQVERDFLNQLVSMNGFQQLSPLQKLTPLMSEFNDDRPISCSGVMEFRYHVEFLIEHLVAYCQKVCIAPLVRANSLNTKGEVLCLTEEQKRRQGVFIGEYVEKMLKPLFDRLRAIDYAEANRSKVEAELRLLVDKIRAQADAFSQAVNEYGEHYLSANRQSGHIQNTHIEQRRARFMKLMECAPAGVQRPEPPYDDILHLTLLYQGTEVTEAKLRELLDGGLSNDNHFLQLVAKYGDWPGRLSLINYFLARGAVVDYVEAGVQTLARAYGTAVRYAEANNLQPRIPDMEVIALLEGAKRLFPQDPADIFSWLSEITYGIFRVISAKTGIAVAHYQEKYTTFVTDLVRRLLLSLYVGPVVNKRIIKASPFFQNLCGMWDYLATPLQTVQLFLGEKHALDAGELNQLKRALLDLVRNSFRNMMYKEVKALRDKMIRPFNLAELVEWPTLMRLMEERGVDDAPRYQEELMEEQANERLALAQLVARQELEAAREHEMAALWAQQRAMLELVGQVGGSQVMQQMIAVMQRQLAGAEQQAHQAPAVEWPPRLLDAPQPPATAARNRVVAELPVEAGDQNQQADVQNQQADVQYQQGGGQNQQVPLQTAVIAGEAALAEQGPADAAAVANNPQAPSAEPAAPGEDVDEEEEGPQGEPNKRPGI
jgi:hypothetical protein